MVWNEFEWAGAEAGDAVVQENVQDSNDWVDIESAPTVRDTNAGAGTRPAPTVDNTISQSIKKR